MQIAGKAQVTNAQNARTYYDRGIRNNPLNREQSL